MTNSIKRLWSEESGQGLSEYGLILGLVAVVVIVALGAVGTHLNTILGKIGTKLEEAASK